MGGAVTGIVLTLVMIGLGTAIRFGKAAWLISGYNTSSKKKKAQYDIDKLCTAVGNLLFVMGGILAASTMAGLLMPAHLTAIIYTGGALYVLAIICGLVYMNTGRRMMKPRDDEQSK